MKEPSIIFRRRKLWQKSNFNILHQQYPQFSTKANYLSEFNPLMRGTCTVHSSFVLSFSLHIDDFTNPLSAIIQIQSLPDLTCLPHSQNFWEKLFYSLWYYNHHELYWFYHWHYCHFNITMLTVMKVRFPHRKQNQGSG